MRGVLPLDDLGHPLELTGPARRVVSLVPSLTETLALARPEAVVGATDWCTHPPDLDVRRVRGTKNPDLAAIRALRPDVVVANREENRELDVRRLRAAGIAVWVTEIADLPGALGSLGRLFAALGWPRPEWLAEAREVWSAPATLPAVSAAIAVWRDPWMVVGGGTFAGDLLHRLGPVNAYADAPRYPHVDVAEIEQVAQLVVLPDEPYAFDPDDGPEAFAVPTALVSGRALTWYGPSLTTARRELTDALLRAMPEG
ncbi:helical backbone metal receptor [Allobranchiibius sp. CTAmp26]|uniref:helical backbone metal receptor n=1 Tax=Allobranchiibius sp. CTAmp26 TaxID=2815214 RepID=UPI001AA1BB52|nr:helical backbone metal receptor [Allobranchiibius sp. CTAmp26]MBO1755006.1 cobalamin-binding protein [Allobranchiibius sp. CTAmp26]